MFIKDVPPLLVSCSDDQLSDGKVTTDIRARWEEDGSFNDVYESISKAYKARGYASINPDNQVFLDAARNFKLGALHHHRGKIEFVATSSSDLSSPAPPPSSDDIDRELALSRAETKRKKGEHVKAAAAAEAAAKAYKEAAEATAQLEAYESAYKRGFKAGSEKQGQLYRDEIAGHRRQCELARSDVLRANDLVRRLQRDLNHAIEHQFEPQDNLLAQKSLRKEQLKVVNLAERVVRDASRAFVRKHFQQWKASRTRHSPPRSPPPMERLEPVLEEQDTCEDYVWTKLEGWSSEEEDGVAVAPEP